MNILGVGPGEIVVVLILMLVVAGPKRMAQWAFQIGRYTARLRAMYTDTMTLIQKEMEQAGVEVPQDLPNIRNLGADVLREASDIINKDIAEPASGTVPAAPPSSPEDLKPVVPDTPPTPTPGSNSNSEPDHDTPRYDAWTRK